VLHDWALQWGVPLAALHDLERRMGLLHDPQLAPSTGRSEAAVQANVRIEAAQLALSGRRVKLFRNNVGALKDARGVPVRYGLANDTPAMNAVIKSADLIGWETITITPDMVGQDKAVFLSVECKEEGWTFTASQRERAQQAWAALVAAGGGRALFANRTGLL
jgi:hypothetical protein